MSLNTEHNADLVVANSSTGYSVWIGDEIAASTNLAGLSIMIAGAIANKLSVYGVEAGQFVVGSVNELTRAPDQQSTGA